MKKTKSKLNNILGDGDIQAIGNIVGGLMDKQAAVLASKKDLLALEARMTTKDDLHNLEKNMKDYIHQGTQAVMNGMDNLSERFVERQQFEKLLAWARVVGEKVGVRPKM